MPQAFRPLRDEHVRPLRSSDDPAMSELRAACSEQEWQDGALSAAGEIRFGRFDGPRLVAVAGLQDWPHEEPRRAWYRIPVTAVVVTQPRWSARS